MERTATWPRGRPLLGQRAERSRVIEPEFIRLFTTISGDRNPLHYDEDVARASRFGEIVVQGGVTSSILNAVVAEELPGPGTVFMHVDWRFTAPVRPGDTITGQQDDPQSCVKGGDKGRRELSNHLRTIIFLVLVNSPARSR